MGVRQWEVGYESPGRMVVRAEYDDGAHPSVSLIVMAHWSLIGRKKKKTRSRVMMVS